MICKFYLGMFNDLQMLPGDVFQTNCLIGNLAMFGRVYYVMTFAHVAHRFASMAFLFVQAAWQVWQVR